MFAVPLALTAQEFPAGRDRGTATGLYEATIGAAVAIGPPTDRAGSWRRLVGSELVLPREVPIPREKSHAVDASSLLQATDRHCGSS